MTTEIWAIISSPSFAIKVVNSLFLKAGIYVGENDATISLLEDTKLCFNEYGLAIGQPIKPNTTGVEFALNKKANQQSMISLSGLKADAFTQGSTLQAASGVLNGVYYSKDSGIFLNSEVLTEDMVSFSKNGTYSIELSGVSVAEGTTLVIAPFDKSIIKEIWSTFNWCW